MQNCIQKIRSLIFRDSVLSSAVLLSLSSFISRLLGMIRDRMIAGNFGVGCEVDAYYAAFRIPDFIYNILILGALSASFVPMLSKYIRSHAVLDKESIKLINNVLNVLTLSVLALSSVVLFFLSAILRNIYTGFDAETLLLTQKFASYMMIAPIFFGISNVFYSVLNVYKRYIYLALSPILYNLGIIFGIFFLHEKLGMFSAVVGVIFGSFFHLLIHVLGVNHLNYSYRFFVDLRDYAMKKVFRKGLPRVVGLIGTQINLLVITAIGSLVSKGAISVFNYANNIQSFPLGLIGIPLAITSFPLLSQAVARNETENFRKVFRETFEMISFFIIPITILFILLRAQIVRIILGTGEFDWFATYHTAQSLGFFALGLFSQCLIPFLARTFYALSDTITPVVISLVTIIVNIFLSLYFAETFMIEGLALAFSLSSIFQLLSLLIVLRIKVGNLHDRKIFSKIVSISMISLAMGFFVYVSLNVMSEIVNMRTFVGIFLQGAVSFMVGVFVFLLLAWKFGIEEIKKVREIIIKS